jgi:hypothetical protein
MNPNKKPFNFEEILFHLREAREEIENSIREILEEGEAISEDDMHCAFLHLYHHINSAWHSRYARPDYVQTDDEFYSDRRFPLEDFISDLNGRYDPKE